MRRRERSGAATVAKPTKNPRPSLISPFPVGTPDPPSKLRGGGSKPYAFHLDSLTSSHHKKALASSSSFPPLLRPSSSPLLQKTPASVSGLKDLVASRTGELKRSLDLCHAEVLKEFEASQTRIAKRLKMQTQACVQITDEAEKEYRKMSDRINENTDLIKSSYLEFINEAQASASRVCKVSIPELAQSLEKSIEGLRNRYKIPSTPA